MSALCQTHSLADAPSGRAGSGTSLPDRPGYASRALALCAIDTRTLSASHSASKARPYMPPRLDEDPHPGEAGTTEKELQRTSSLARATLPVGIES